MASISDIESEFNSTLNRRFNAAFQSFVDSYTESSNLETAISDYQDEYNTQLELSDEQLEKSEFQNEFILAALLFGAGQANDDLSNEGVDFSFTPGFSAAANILQLNIESFAEYRNKISQMLRDIFESDISDDEKMQSASERSESNNNAQSGLVSETSTYNSERTGAEAVLLAAIAAGINTNVIRVTRGDDRVRPLHARYDGAVTSNETFNQIQTIDGFRCRCRKKLTMRAINMGGVENKKNWYSIKNLADGEAELCIYDEIGYWGVTAENLKNELRAIGTKTPLRVVINSPGGSVFDGLAIYNMLSMREGKTTAYIEGVAASIASIIAMAADEVVMPENAFIMIHRPFSGAAGESDELRRQADLLDKLESQLVSIYSARTGINENRIGEMLEAETWLSGAEAVELGFADTLEQRVDIAAKFDLTMYNKAPVLLNSNKIEAEKMAEKKEVEELELKKQKLSDENNELKSELDSIKSQLAVYQQREQQEIQTAIKNATQITGEDAEFFDGMSVEKINKISNMKQQSIQNNLGDVGSSAAGVNISEMKL